MKTMLVSAAFLLCGAAAILADEPAQHGGAEHTVVQPSAIQWGPAPPGLPPGAQVGVLFGNPGKAGPFVLRAKLPDGYKVAPHSHPSGESITVLQGALLAGAGEEFD